VWLLLRTSSGYGFRSRYILPSITGGTFAAYSMRELWVIVGKQPCIRWSSNMLTWVLSFPDAGAHLALVPQFVSRPFCVHSVPRNLCLCASSCHRFILQACQASIHMFDGRPWPVLRLCQFGGRASRCLREECACLGSRLSPFLVPGYSLPDLVHSWFRQYISLPGHQSPLAEIRFRRICVFEIMFTFTRLFAVAALAMVANAQRSVCGGICEWPHCL
jgi:hypothetical protein